MRLGAKVSPEILALLFRAGVLIKGEAFQIRLVENAIPQDLKLVQAFQDPETKEFIFLFGQKKEAKAPVTWLTPIYEKERDHGTKP